MAIQFHDGGILFVDGAIAMDPACCCEPPSVCCSPIPNSVSCDLSNIVLSKHPLADCASCSSYSCTSLETVVFSLYSTEETGSYKRYNYAGVYGAVINPSCHCLIGFGEHYFRGATSASVYLTLYCYTSTGKMKWDLVFTTNPGTPYMQVTYTSGEYSANSDCADDFPVELSLDTVSPWQCDDYTENNGVYQHVLCCIDSYPSTLMMNFVS